MQKLYKKVDQMVASGESTAAAACEKLAVHPATYYAYRAKRLKEAKSAAKAAKKAGTAPTIQEIAVTGGKTLLVVTDDSAIINSILENFR